MPPRLVWPLMATLGEGPIYVARENALYFVDIKKPALHRLSLNDESKQTWDMPEPLGWVIERKDGAGFIAGFKSGFYELTLDPVMRRLIAEPEADRPHNRRNDAKADKYGRIWAGSMDDREIACSGAITRLDPDYATHRVEDGYNICNGPAFSVSGDVMYHTDTPARAIYAYDLGADGSLSHKRDFIRFPEDWGYPDGMTTDAEDHLWVCHWDGARISRFTPEGALDRAIPMPVPRVTSCCFAGPALDRLFVTTAAIGVDHIEGAGGLYELAPGIRGLPANLFG